MLTQTTIVVIRGKKCQRIKGRNTLTKQAISWTPAAGEFITVPGNLHLMD
jgi:hypothetical protein